MLEIRGFSPGMMKFIGKPDSGIDKKPAKEKVIQRATRIGLKKGISPVADASAEGSSRLYMELKEPENIKLDGKPASIRTGVKVALRAAGHLRRKFEKGRKKGVLVNTSIGAMQNEAENGDSYVNQRYRVITKNDDGSHSTNTEHGIFPPLIDHDKKNHEWAHVGHTEDVEEKDFPKLTRTESHPQGITHNDFTSALHRDYERQNGNYIIQHKEVESHLDHVQKHPLVQKFLAHQREIYTPPHDYGNTDNLGVWTHPHTGEKHIVARDHGLSEDVSKFYARRWIGSWKTTASNKLPPATKTPPWKTTRISTK